MRRERPRRRALRVLAALAAAAVLLAVGIALGAALHDNPRPGGTLTRVRTLIPQPLPPARETVTVTTTP